MQDYCILVDTKQTDIDKILDDIKKNNYKEVCFTYVSDFIATKVLRDIISEISDYYELDFILKSRLVLLIDELNNNAIEYGSVNGEKNKLIFKVNETLKETIINIEVVDTGNGKHAKTAEEMEEVRTNRKNKGFDNHKSIRGRGLFLIIEKIANKLYFENSPQGGLVVGAELVLSK